MNLTKEQTTEVLSNFLKQEHGLNQVLEMVLNSMMLCEREEFLSQSQSNKGNGYRLGRVFGHGSSMELRIPRDRLSEFTPTILALFRDQEEYIKEVSFDLYSKGLTTRDVSDVMETIYGKHYSKSTISNFSQSFYERMETWRSRALESHYLALFIDGTYVKVKRANRYQNESFYIVLGLREDYTREVIAIVNLPQESSTGWQQVLTSLKERGLKTVGLFVSDALKGLEQVIQTQFSQSDHQLCIVHLHRNLGTRVRPEDKPLVRDGLRDILDPDNKYHNYESAMERYQEFKALWAEKYPSFGRYLNQLDITPYLTFLNYDTRIRRMVYSTNWIERFNKSVKRTLKIRGGMPNEESVLALITSVAIDKGTKKYNYPIHIETSFKYLLKGI